MIETATRRVLLATVGMLLLVATGSVLLWLLGAGQWGVGETVWMAITSVTTVGFGELPGMEHTRGARVVVASMVLCGVVALAYFQSSITTALVEGTFGKALRRRSMNRQIEALRGHIVVAGAGRTGGHVIDELVAADTPFVVIDRSREHLERIGEALGGKSFLFIHGDATHDQILLAAGVSRAAGVIAALTDDRDNLYVTLSARTLNPDARIVAKVVEAEAEAKMRRAGANATVSPNILGGRRLAREVVHPDVLAFLDSLAKSRGEGLQFASLVLKKDSAAVGERLGNLSPIKQSRARVLAVRHPGEDLVVQPGAECTLEAGTVLVALGTGDELERLAEALDAEL